MVGQVLRYNESQAYVAHYDYLESAEGHNFDSAGLGTNRFATVIYLMQGVCLRRLHASCPRTFNRIFKKKMDGVSYSYTFQNLLYDIFRLEYKR